MSSMNKLRTWGLIFFVLCLVFPHNIRADVYIKQKNHTDGFSMMGQNQPAKDDVLISWMGKDKARMDHGEDATMIIRMDKKIMYMVDHSEMRYTEMPLDEEGGIFAAAIAASSLSSEEQAAAKKMMAGFADMMKPTISVQDTGEAQKIKNWNCRKYNMTMSIMGMTTTSEVWATEEIKIDFELYRSLTFALLGQTQGSEDMLQEMAKIKGIVVLSTGSMSLMGTEVKSTQELLEVTEKPAPGGTYEVPEGYKKQD